MTVNNGYVVTEDGETWSRSRAPRDEREYTYDEAIDLAGNGLYNWTLLATLTVATLSMAVDIFGFSVVVTGASCEFDLGVRETGILLAVTFIGPITMAFPWGYVSDTYGRRRSLLISLWSSFIVSSVSAFSPDWTTLAVFKFISTSFSSCAQSATYTLLGESCSRRFRDMYMLIMTSILNCCLAIYVVIAYLILNMDFSYDLGYITFSPWRLLSLALSFITGLGALGVLFFYESPKFLLNIKREEEALDALVGIWSKNGGQLKFPVKKIVLNEAGNERADDSSRWSSLWGQLVPLFRPPLLWRSLQLYFLAAVAYGTNNAYFIWLPYLGEQFVKNINSNQSDEHSDLCSMIVAFNETHVQKDVECSSSMDISLVWFSLIQGFSFVAMMMCIARIAHRKRLLIITILLISSLSGVGAVYIQDTTVGFLMLLGVLLEELLFGVIYSYFLDLYPTSFRGTAACLCTMVARCSALTGVSLLEKVMASHCSHSFHFCSVLLLSRPFPFIRYGVIEQQTSKYPNIHTFTFIIFISRIIVICIYIGGVLVALFLPKDKDRPEI